MHSCVNTIAIGNTTSSQAAPHALGSQAAVPSPSPGHSLAASSFSCSGTPAPAASSTGPGAERWLRVLLGASAVAPLLRSGIPSLGAPQMVFGDRPYRRRPARHERGLRPLPHDGRETAQAAKPEAPHQPARSARAWSGQAAQFGPCFQLRTSQRKPGVTPTGPVGQIGRAHV